MMIVSSSSSRVISSSFMLARNTLMTAPNGMSRAAIGRPTTVPVPRHAHVHHRPRRPRSASGRTRWSCAPAPACRSGEAHRRSRRGPQPGTSCRPVRRDEQPVVDQAAERREHDLVLDRVGRVAVPRRGAHLDVRRAEERAVRVVRPDQVGRVAHHQLPEVLVAVVVLEIAPVEVTHTPVRVAA